MADFDIARFLRPGDRVVIGQAVAEPPGLVRKLLNASHSVDDLTVFCGYTLSDEWRALDPKRLRVESYGAHAALRRIAEARQLQIIPVHLSDLERIFARGDIRVDVVLLQVGAKDNGGYYDLGPTADYVAGAASMARTVLVEVNANMPRTSSARRLHESRVTAAIDSDSALVASPARKPNDAEVQVAANVARYVRSGSTIQLGIGALADAIAREIRQCRNLRVRSGLVGDWLVDLYDAGSMDGTAGSCIVSMAVGSGRLYRFVDDNDTMTFVPSQDLVAGPALVECEHFVAMNSAVEVDLLGQVNSEVAQNRYVGAIGGQVDFFRATRMSRSGTAVVALAATSSTGESRIVERLSGPVTTLKNDYDVLVTEWGVAELAGLPLSDRVAAIAKVAHPDHRAALLASDAFHTWGVGLEASAC